jgi:hypothetical protein
MTGSTPHCCKCHNAPNFCGLTTISTERHPTQGRRNASERLTRPTAVDAVSGVFMPTHRVHATNKLSDARVRTRKQKLSEVGLARVRGVSQDMDVVPVNILSRRLREELERSAANKGSALRSLDAPALDEVSTICARVLASFADSSVASTEVVDPVSGLKLPPPPPALLYRDRKSIPELRKATPEEFINQVAPWSEYLKAGLLAADFVRTIDPSLYFALSGRASYRGKTISDLMSEIGMLGRHRLEHPQDPETARIARLVRAAQAIQAIDLLTQNAEQL